MVKLGGSDGMTPARALHSPLGFKGPTIEREKKSKKKMFYNEDAD
jgi:hypothetical protein